MTIMFEEGEQGVGRLIWILEHSGFEVKREGNQLTVSQIHER